MGRVGVDLYPQQAGQGLEDAETLVRDLGGSPTNVAIAAARLGRRVAVVTRVGDDPLGRHVRTALRGHGVDDRYVTAVDGWPTPVTFVQTDPPEQYFYRFPKAPDLTIRASELDYEAIGAAKVFWATVTGLSMEPVRQATLAALGVRSRQAHTVLDMYYRSQFWSSPENARRWTVRALKHATIAIGTLPEYEMALGESDPEAAAKALLGCGVELAVVKLGAAGVLAATPQGVLRFPSVSIERASPHGAGEAFGGGLVHGLLAGWDLADTLRFAGAAGAIVASRATCSAAMPTEAEVLEILRAGDSRDGMASPM